MGHVGEGTTVVGVATTTTTATATVLLYSLALVDCERETMLLLLLLLRCSIVVDCLLLHFSVFVFCVSHRINRSIIFRSVFLAARILRKLGRSRAKNFGVTTRDGSCQGALLRKRQSNAASRMLSVDERAENEHLR